MTRNPVMPALAIPEMLKSGAAYRIRTYDPLITNEVLYQLS
jgi:hypothetical protein